MDREILAKAFLEGFELGRAHAEKVYGTKKISVEQDDSAQTIRLVRLDNGELLNIGGRSLPF